MSPGVTYAEYIVSDEWAAMKRRYRRSGMPLVCQGRRGGVACTRTRVDFHHWTYANLGREQLSDLIPLCRECHDFVHALAGTGGKGALKRATKLVCGSDILKRQQQAQRDSKRVVRRLPHFAPAEVSPPIRLRAAARPAPRPKPPPRPVSEYKRGEIKPWDTAQVRLAHPAPKRNKKRRAKKQVAVR